ncbi:hypothetical protein SDC9_61307 [bioreactor metagenome]|uniref:Transglutaminase-like domain-containing protein n=1 Tax=bioreactor metagenome TaxID=1076179 RepID=A0A644XL34_9ZZZZ|nr:transglutaminase-like domain-containing protein [Sphaerochaeta sp.]
MESSDLSQYLQPTPLLDYQASPIQALMVEKGWESLSTKTAQIEAVYTYVRDEIAYGYTTRFQISATQVLASKQGNCITKTTLLMALLRSIGIPCRLKAGLVEKVIHRGLLHGMSYTLSPAELYHTWLEVRYNNRWVEIGGHIVDRPYLQKLQAKFPDFMGSFYGYGIAVLHFRNPPIQWEENDTFVQHKAIKDMLGTYSDPDGFFKAYPQAEKYTSSIRYKTILRSTLNSAITTLRQS